MIFLIYMMTLIKKIFNHVNHSSDKGRVNKMAMSIGHVIQKAREELNKVTGLDLATTLKTKKDDKGWHVSIEMIEKHSIPDGMDILATYEVLLDEDGNLIEFNRQGMRKRMDMETVG